MPEESKPTSMVSNGISMRSLRLSELVLLWYADPTSVNARFAADEVMRRINDGEIVIAHEGGEAIERWHERWRRDKKSDR